MLSALFFCLLLAPILLLLSFGSYTFNQSTSIVSSIAGGLPKECTLKKLGLNNSTVFYIMRPPPGFNQRYQMQPLPGKSSDTNGFNLVQQNDGKIIASGTFEKWLGGDDEECYTQNIKWYGPPGKSSGASIAAEGRLHIFRIQLDGGIGDYYFVPV